MSHEQKIVDWANISDEEEDDDYSPVNEHSNEQIQHEEEQRDYEGDQGVEPVSVINPKQTQVQTVPMTAEELRESMISHIKNSQNPKVYLNLHGLDPTIAENDIRDFYHPLNIDRVIPNQKKDMVDLEFANKDDALKVVEKGAGTIQNCTFAMRMSRRTQYNERKQQDPNRRDKNGKGYGKKGQGQGQQRNYNKGDRDRGDNRGGNYGLNRQGSYKGGDYNQRDSYNQRGSYNQGNREDRGGYNNYEQRGQDGGANRRRNDDRNQQRGPGGPRKDNYKDNYNQQHQQQQQIPIQNIRSQGAEEEKNAEETPKRKGFFNKNKEEELQREKQRQEDVRRQEEEQAELKRQEELRLERERQEEQQRKQEEERQRKLKEEEQLREAQKNQAAQSEREGGQRGQEYPEKKGDRNYPRKDSDQRRKDYGGDRNYDNRQKGNRNQYDNRKGDDYYRNYKGGEENKQAVEQGKDLQVVKRQSSYRSQGSGKYYEKGGNYTPKYANFEDDWGYEDDNANYQKKEYQPARTPKGNSSYNYDETGKVSRKNSKPYEKESVVYMKKQESQPAPSKPEPNLEINKNASEPVNKDTKKGKEEPAKKNPALPSSKNKVNPYDLLRGNT